MVFSVMHLLPPLQASCKQLRGGKVVHLRVMLKSIVPAGKNASAILKDPTGIELAETPHSQSCLQFFIVKAIMTS